MQLTNFSIFKNLKKEKESQPDYTITTKIGEEYKTIGAGWIKEGKNGKYISCKVDDTPYQPKLKEINTVQYPTDDIDPTKIPF